MKLTELYEKEVGLKAMYRMKSSDYHNLSYVYWLEEKIKEQDSNFVNPLLSEVMTKIEEISFLNDRTDLLVANIDDIEKILSHYFR